jgi:diaminohydroxyphosphoribosylaminopyrimidine deaminase/5-amino-6-(5-phosphoribosylamino)uracil reductase
MTTLRLLKSVSGNICLALKLNIMQTQADTNFMQHALRLAQAARYRTSPNPRIGCVLVKDGIVIGEGATQAAGSAHAEVDAIKNAAARGNDTHGATAYVTLEPCNHTGRTGPCSHALLAAGVTRVAAAMQDPNPLTAGGGFKTLRDAGVTVTVGVDEATTQLALELNIGFFKRIATGLPWVRLKVATSLDGFVALPNGQSQWLTGDAARTDTHHWRASACAVVTGIGTVLADNPQLTVRHVATSRQPLRVVLDTHLRTPVDAALFKEKSPVMIFHSHGTPTEQAALQAAGAQLVQVDALGDSVNIHSVLKTLGERGLNELHFEAGSALNGALLAAGVVDEVLLYQAPLLLGAGLPWARVGESYEHVSEVPRLRLHSAAQLGADARLVLHTSSTWVNPTHA